MATGVLVLGLGRATRLLGYVAGHDKDYLATIRLGQTTPSDDADSAPDGGADAATLTDEAVRAAMLPLTGAISQVPSAVSAIKVDGQRAYKLVRAGEDVELKPRSVEVARFEALGFHRIAASPEHHALLDVEVAVTCSTGTYVRALARDLGASLGVGGHLTMLRRTRVGGFGIDGAVEITDELDVRAQVIPIGEAMRAAFEWCAVDEAGADALTHGRTIPVPESVTDPTSGRSVPYPADASVAIVGPDGRGLAIVEQREGVLRPVVVFV
jgi:tRNA pseudouridine55 synthase